MPGRWREAGWPTKDPSQLYLRDSLLIIPPGACRFLASPRPEDGARRHRAEVAPISTEQRHLDSRPVLAGGAGRVPHRVPWRPGLPGQPGGGRADPVLLPVRAPTACRSPARPTSATSPRAHPGPVQADLRDRVQHPHHLPARQLRRRPGPAGRVLTAVRPAWLTRARQEAARAGWHRSGQVARARRAAAALPRLRARKL
jgi:hypothetical protein